MSVKLQIISELQLASDASDAYQRWVLFCQKHELELVDYSLVEVNSLPPEKVDLLKAEGVISITKPLCSIIRIPTGVEIKYCYLEHNEEFGQVFFEIVARILQQKKASADSFFDLIYEQTDFPVVVLNEACEFVYASPSIEYIVGESRDAFTERGLSYYFTEESKNLWESSFNLTRKLITANIYPIAPLYLEFELNLVPKIHIDLRLQTIFDTNKQFNYFYLEITDNTERKQLEKAISSLNEELSVKWERSVYLFENGVDPIFIHSAEGRLYEVNDTACKKMGLVKDTVLDLNFFNIVKGIDTAFFHKSNYTSKHEQVAEVVFVTANGSDMFLELKSKPIDYMGKALFMSFMRDVTLRKSAQNELLESEARYRMLIEEIPCGVILVQNNKFAFVNNIAANILGYSSTQPIVGAKVKAILKGDEWTLLYQKLECTTAAGNFDLKVHNSKSAIVYLRITLASTVFKGAPAQIVMAVDVTQQKLTEQELIEAKELAEENDQLKTNFLMNISHEVRTPLNAINGFSLLLESEDDMPEDLRSYYLKIISDNAQQLTETISNLVEVSEIQAGAYDLLPYSSNVEAFFYDINKEFQDKVSKVVFSVSACNELNIKQVIFDGQRVKQLLALLLNNAIKFTHEGSVELSYTIHANTIHFEVKDTGVGIAESKMKDIFKLFTQGEKISINRTYGGTGVGLFLVKQLVRLLGGEIRATSQIGIGTVFYIDIPIETDVVEISEEEKVVDFDWSGKHILVVEDTFANMVFLEQVFSIEGVILGKASTGTDALLYIDKYNDIDLVLLDIQLPDINGYDLIGTIKKRNDVLVVAQTAYALNSDRQKVKQSGFDGYIAKPIDPADLLQLCGRLLSSK